ncbi:MAG: RNA polymerase sigma factor [Acidimicrobiales bacterium]
MEETDSALVVRSLSQPEAFGSLFERHGTAILRFILRRVPPSEAEGMLGEVFGIAFQRRASFDPTREPRPWLYGIAANLVAKHHRAEMRRMAAVARLAARPEHRDDPADHAVAAADAERAVSQLLCAVAALNRGEREVLLLYSWEELTYGEIAMALDIPVGTVRSRLSRARTKLRRVADAARDKEDHGER